MLLATLVCALAPQGTDAAVAPEVGHVAPPHGLDMWVPNGDANGTRSVDGVEVGPLQPRELHDWLGSVVIVHAMYSWDVKGNGLMLVRDLFKANRHRRLKALSISVDTIGTDKLEARRDKYGLEHPVGVIGVGESPYFVSADKAVGHVFVIGPSGGVAWSGDPVGDEKDLLKAVRAALECYPARPLERDSSELLLPAQRLYFAGEWDAARKAAEKVRRKAQTKDPETADEATALIELFDSQMGALDGELNGLAPPFTDGGRAAIRLLRAIENGFPKSDLAKRAEERLADIKNALVVPALLDDATKWVALEEDRPVLFPERKDKKGDHHARELERLLKRLTDGSSLRRLGMAQLDRYAQHD